MRQYGGALYGLLRVMDVLIVIFCAWLAYVWRFDSHSLPGNYELAVVLGVLLSAMVFSQFGVYRRRRGSALLDELGRLSLAWMLVGSVLVVLAFTAKMGADYSRIWGVTWFGLTWVLLLVSRLFIRVLVTQMRLARRNLRNVLIVGSDGLGYGVAERLMNSPWTGLRVAALVGEDAEGVGTVGLPDSIVIESDIEACVSNVREHSIDQVWLALPLSKEKQIRKIYDELRQTTVDVRLVPEVSELRLLNRQISDVAGLPVVELSFSPLNAGNQWIKALEDRLVGLLIVLLISPLMLLIALAIKWDSSDPVLFKQRRHGLGGGEIVVYKFRTMSDRPNADMEAKQAAADDPRVTRLGAFLRRTSLDELPQFINVLQGRMSIVGPRPHPLWLNEQHMHQIDAYAQRHKVKPGITGWAQVNGFRGETDTLEKMQKRVEYDLYYIEHWSLLFDLRIILMTIFKGFVNPNAY